MLALKTSSCRPNTPAVAAPKTHSHDSIYENLEEQHKEAWPSLAWLFCVSLEHHKSLGPSRVGFFFQNPSRRRRRRLAIDLSAESPDRESKGNIFTSRLAAASVSFSTFLSSPLHLTHVRGSEHIDNWLSEESRRLSRLENICKPLTSKKRGRFLGNSR
jgi:hypothetical protein